VAGVVAGGVVEVLDLLVVEGPLARVEVERGAVVDVDAGQRQAV